MGRRVAAGVGEFAGVGLGSLVATAVAAGVNVAEVGVTEPQPTVSTAAIPTK